MSEKSKKIKVVYKKIGDLNPYANNPRINDDAVPDVAKSIERFGFLVPIVISKDNTVVAGHTRLKASKTLGLTEVPCIVADDLTEDEIDAFRLTDNQTSSKAGWDFPMLDLEWDRLEERGWDREEFGFVRYEDEPSWAPEEPEPMPEPMGGDGEKLYPVIVNCHSEEDRDMIMEMMEAEGRSCRKMR